MLLTIVGLTLTGLIVSNNTAVITIQEPIEVLETDTVEPLDTLVEALIHVESRGIEGAVGDTHLGTPSVGVLQIRPVMVREVNRILKKQKSTKRFSLKDRFSRVKSIEMFSVWRGFHHPNDNYEKTARNWNGGPKGYKRNATRNYWNKVKSRIDEYKSNRSI